MPENVIDPKIAAQFSGDDLPVEEIQTSDPITPKPAAADQTPALNNEPPAGDYKPLPIWDYFVNDMKTVDPNYKLPEVLTTGKLEDGTALTPEKEYQMLAQQIADNTDTGEDDDHFIQEYRRAKNSDGFQLERWLSQRTEEQRILSMPSDDLIRNALISAREQKQNNYTDEQINDYISKLDPIQKDLQANNLREAIKIEIAKRQEQANIIDKQAYDAEIADLNNTIKQELPKVFEVTNKLTHIGGLPHGEAERAEFQPIFEKLVEINPQTGLPRVNEIFADSRTLYEALFLLTQAKNGAISQFKETFKADILAKLGINRNSDRSGIQTPSPKAPSSEDYI